MNTLTIVQNEKEIRKINLNKKQLECILFLLQNYGKNGKRIYNKFVKENTIKNK